jgi:cellulose biosynthesis protein BcsQ
MSVLAIWTIKGGVGKTAAAVNLAHLAASSGIRTLLWDLDPQGAASFYFRIRPRLKGGVRRVVKKSGALGRLVQATDYDNLRLLPADFSLRHLDLELDNRANPVKPLARKIKALHTGHDVLFLDCPPSVSLTSEAVVQVADALLVPVIPSTLSVRTLEQVVAFVAGLGRAGCQVLPFLSMVDRRKRLHRDICEQFASGREGFLESSIPSASLVERMGLARVPVTASAPSSPPARAFAELWQEVRQRLLP